jgi:zinc transport system substrate-binding protein
MKNHLLSLIVFIAATVVIGATIVAAIIFTSLREKTEPSVAATIFPIYDIAKNIAGEAVRVTLLLPPGADAHSFEPSPSLLKELNGAVAVYAIGYRLDEWSTTLTEAVSAETVFVDKNIFLKPSANVSEEGPYDPHYWLTVPNAKIIAGSIADDMKARFPDKAQVISNNLKAYLSTLDVLDQEIRFALKDIPNKNIVTFHDAWYYFADEYGLTVAGTFEPTAGREPTPQYLADLVTKISAAGVKTLYYEPQMSITGYQTFADDYDIKLKVLDDIGGIPPYDSYIDLIKTNVATLQNNQ